jgi:hypothetical protein
MVTVTTRASASYTASIRRAVYSESSIVGSARLRA